MRCLAGFLRPSYTSMNLHGADGSRPLTCSLDSRPRQGCDFAQAKHSGEREQAHGLASMRDAWRPGCHPRRRVQPDRAFRGSARFRAKPPLAGSDASADHYDLTYDLVRVSSRIGDYQAAIGALERLLFYNPDLARVRYELGSLYTGSAPTKWRRAISRRRWRIPCSTTRIRLISSAWSAWATSGSLYRG